MAPILEREAATLSVSADDMEELELLEEDVVDAAMKIVSMSSLPQSTRL